MHPSSAPWFNSSSWASLDLDGAHIGSVIFLTPTRPICSVLKVCDHRYLTWPRGCIDIPLTCQRLSVMVLAPELSSWGRQMNAMIDIYCINSGLRAHLFHFYFLISMTHNNVLQKKQFLLWCQGAYECTSNFGPPWWLGVKESACQRRRQGFNSRCGKTPHTCGPQLQRLCFRAQDPQLLGPRATPTAACVPAHASSKGSPPREEPALCTEE